MDLLSAHLMPFLISLKHIGLLLSSLFLINFNFFFFMILQEASNLNQDNDLHPGKSSRFTLLYCSSSQLRARQPYWQLPHTQAGQLRGKKKDKHHPSPAVPSHTQTNPARKWQGTAKGNGLQRYKTLIAASLGMGEMKEEVSNPNQTLHVHLRLCTHSHLNLQKTKSRRTTRLDKGIWVFMLLNANDCT